MNAGHHSTTPPDENSQLRAQAAALAPLLPPGEVVELRAPDAEVGRGYTATLSGYFDDPVRLVAEAMRLTPTAPAVYITLNAVNPALLARSENRVKQLKKDGKATTAKDINRRRWLMIDIDPARPSGICATDTEKTEALAVAERVKAFLAKAGWPAPLVIDSGNGLYLLYAVDLPVEDGKLVLNCLKALAKRFDTAAAHIDQGVNGPQQLIRLPGTLNRKGDSTADRPHRLVAILEQPDELRVVPEELLQALAAEAALPPPPRGGTDAGGFQHRLDVPKYLAHFGVEVLGEKDLPDGRHAWRVVCPFDPAHTGTDSNVMQDDSGKLGFRCFHSSCNGLGWQKFRDAVGKPLPEHYDPPLGDNPKARFTGDTTTNTPPPPPDAAAKSEWPAPPAEEAFHGLMGEIVRTLEPETEADPVALLVQGLVMFGNVIGRHAHYRVEGTKHFTNEFAVLVGSSSTGKKGTSHGRVKPLFKDLDDNWLKYRNLGGISSAEGLLWQVRDANERDEDPGESDKRLCLTESEFANVLKQVERQGNTVSVYLRQLWDGEDVVQTLTKNTPVKATAPHVSLIGHITHEELSRCLTATETANGFANRFLFVCVKRSKLLPDGGTLDLLALPPLTAAVETAAGFAQVAGLVTRHPSARPLWHAVYPILTGERSGLAGAMTARAAPHVLRLALLYALLDRSPVIRPCHLMAALALWDYCERSVIHLFGDKTGDPLADEIRELLRNAPKGLTRSELVAALGRHNFGDKLTTSLNALRTAGLASYETVSTGGRSAERWHATHRPAAESVLMATARRALTGCDESDQSHPPGSSLFRRFHRLCRTLSENTTAIFSGMSSPSPRVPTPSETWLVNQLRDGPRSWADLERLMKVAGATGVKKIGESLRVRITPGRAGCFFWELPVGFDLAPYPAPPEPAEPTLVDDIEPPAADPDAKPKGKRQRSKAKPKPKATPGDAPPSASAGPPSADQVEMMLRKAGRSWSEVAAHLDKLDEYSPTELEVQGLTGKQLQLVADWLAGAN